MNAEEVVANKAKPEGKFMFWIQEDVWTTEKTNAHQ